MSEPTLLPWQAGLRAAGCLQRLAPYLRARGRPREVALFDAGLEALWSGLGTLHAVDAHRFAAVGAMLVDRREGEHEAWILAHLVMAAEAFVQPAPSRSNVTRTRVENLIDFVAESAIEFWESNTPGDVRGEGWGQREARAQRETLAAASHAPAQAAAQVRAASVRLGEEWAAESAVRDVRGDAGWSLAELPPEVIQRGLDFRVGDVVELSCPWTRTVTRSANNYHAFVRWPWAVLDPRSRFRPDGEFAFPIDDASEPWWPYQLRPPAAELRKGDPCDVGIPRGRFYVVGSMRYDPPRDDGFLPRLSASFAVLPSGSGYTGAADVWLGRHEPLEVTLLHRPYATLDSGDVVVDAEGRWLRFHVPFVFEANGIRTQPVWPLTLLSGDAPEDPVAVAAVQAATAEGSHLGEIERWRQWSGVPYPATVAEELFDES
jgi:hypothetical protein